MFTKSPIQLKPISQHGFERKYQPFRPGSKVLSWKSASLFILMMFLTACQVAPVVENTPTPAAPTGTPTAAVTATPELPENSVTATPEAENFSAAIQAHVLRVNLRVFPDRLDPQKVSSLSEFAHIKLIYEGLTRINENMETVPAAAEKWEYNSDATELTFNLRSGLKYSDGSLLNALRYEYALRRVADPATGIKDISLMGDIFGVAEWRLANLKTMTAEDVAALKKTVGIHALDTSGRPCQAAPEGYDQENCLVLKITLNRSIPYFHTLLALRWDFPVKEELITQGGREWWKNPAYQIGNGAYVLKTFDLRSHSYLTPNPNYWRGVAGLDLDFSYIADGLSAYEQYQKGKLDIIPLDAQIRQAVAAAQDPALDNQRIETPGRCTFAMTLPQTKVPFSDPKVREAVSLAIDREAWVRDVLKGDGAAATGWVTGAFQGSNPDAQQAGYNPEAARQALAESRYGRWGVALPAVTASFRDTPENQQRWQWLADRLKEVLSLEILFEPKPGQFLMDAASLNQAVPQTTLAGGCADIPDLHDWLSPYWMTGGSSSAVWGYSNQQVDLLLSRADVEADAAKRLEAYNEVQQLITSENAAVFLWHDVNGFLVKPWVVGAAATPLDTDWVGSIDPLTVIIDPNIMSALFSQ
jgi:oligopeptide transport system substrate-binding protein